MIVNKYQGNGGGGGGSYVLPAATTSTLGGVKIGSGITVQPDGTISAEGGSGEAAYKIELSTSIPDDFTQEDIANLNAFFAAVEADPSIADGAYVMAESTDIYRCSYSEYDSENHYGNFMFDLNMANDTRQIELGFEDGEYVNGGFISWNSSTIIPTYDFPADPIEGQIANYDDGQGNIGLYRYDGTDWVPFGGGDNTVLKASSGTPENIVAGDVYAIYKESKDAQIGDTWVDGIGMNPSWNRYYDGNQPQAIRVGVPQGLMSSDMFNIRYACNDYDTGETVRLDGAGKLSMNTDVWTEVSANHWVLSDAAWVPSRTDGNVLYADYDGTNVYIYSTNVEKIWIMGVENNSTGKNVYTGDVTPPSDAEYKVFQANLKSEPNVKIELEGNARVDGTLDKPEQVVTMSDGSMKISFYDPSIVNGKVCDLESNGTYFHLFYDGSNDAWTLFGSDEESALIKIGDGESGSADFGDGNVYLSYSGGVLTAYTDYDKGWQNWEMGDTHEVIAAQELAKAEDLPSNTRLLPENPNEGDMVIYSDSAWRTTSRDAVFIDGLRSFQNNWTDDGSKYVITRSSFWDVNWEKLSVLEAITTDGIPSWAKEGSVWPTNNTEDGIGIKQHQGLSSTETEWIYKDDIPADRDYSIYSYRVDVSDPNTYAQIDFDIEGCTNNITWGDGAWKSSDIELTDDGNGVYQGTSECGWMVSVWTSGSYFYVYCDYSIEDGVNIYNGGEWEVEVPAPNVANVVTSTDIKRMVKISQADYTALAVKDPETMYIIIG